MDFENSAQFNEIPQFKLEESNALISGWWITWFICLWLKEFVEHTADVYVSTAND